MPKSKVLSLTDDPLTRDFTIPPVQILFAEWLARHDKTPPSSDQLEKFRELSQVSVSESTMFRLKRTEGFERYLRKFMFDFALDRLDAAEKARAKLEKRYPKYIDMFDESVEAAKDMGDHATVIKALHPILDRVAPRKSDQPIQATQVVINISEERQKALDAEVIEVESSEIVSP